VPLDQGSTFPVCPFCAARLIFRGQTSCQSCGKGLSTWAGLPLTSTGVLQATDPLAAGPQSAPDLPAAGAPEAQVGPVSNASPAVSSVPASGSLFESFKLPAPTTLASASLLSTQSAPAAASTPDRMAPADATVAPASHAPVTSPSFSDRSALHEHNEPFGGPPGGPEQDAPPQVPAGPPHAGAPRHGRPHPPQPAPPSGPNPMPTGGRTWDPNTGTWWSAASYTRPPRRRNQGRQDTRNSGCAVLFVIVIALFVIGSISSTMNSGVSSNAFPYDTPYAVFIDNNGNPIAPIAEATTTPAILLGSLTVPRVGHSAQLLPVDRVLIAGGWSAGTVVASSEIFDPTTRQFSPTGDMTEARANFTANLTGDGRVVVIGGQDSDGKALASAETFDPQTDEFAATGAPGSARMNHTATVLTDGKVLVVGGSDGAADLATAELYDPETAEFTSTGSLHIARQGHTATLLSDGRVLIAGGKNQNSAEIYNPRTGTFALAGRMSSVHEDAGAVLLLDGRVMIAGGSDGSHATAAIDFWNPAVASWTASDTGLLTPRADSSLVLLRDGNVMSVGGVDDSGIAQSSVEIYNPAYDNSKMTAETVAPGSRHTATPLWDGTVLVTGGGEGKGGSNSTDLIQP